jgi:hypothetical protein
MVAVDVFGERSAGYRDARDVHHLRAGIAWRSETGIPGDAMG